MGKQASQGISTQQPPSKHHHHTHLGDQTDLQNIFPPVRALEHICPRPGDLCPSYSVVAASTYWVVPQTSKIMELGYEDSLVLVIVGCAMTNLTMLRNVRSQLCLSNIEHFYHNRQGLFSHILTTCQPTLPMLYHHITKLKYIVVFQIIGNELYQFYVTQ